MKRISRTIDELNTGKVVVEWAPGSLSTIPLGDVTGIKGDPGDPGAPGAPGGSDAATASWVSGGSATQAALDARHPRLDRSEIDARTYGLVGGGTTDDVAALTNALSAGITFGLPVRVPPVRVRIGSQLAVPAGSVLRAEGATFVKSTNTSTYGVTLAARVRVDELNVEVAGGANPEAGVQILGSDVRVRSLTVTSMTADQAGTNALLVGNPAGASISDVRLEKVTLTGFRFPLRVTRVDRLELSNLRVTNYVTGAYLIDVTNSWLRGARLSGTSPSAVGSSGQNAFLMEAQGGDNACANVTVEDWAAEDAAEHSFRIGGSLTCRDITLRRCSSRRSGNAAGNTATGSGGIKVLGVGGHHHKRILIDAPVVVDSNTAASGTNNHAALNIGHCDDVTITNPVVQAEANAASARLGLVVFSSTGVVVTNPKISKVTTSPVYAFKDGADSSPLPVTDFQLTGGRLHTNAADTPCVTIDAADQAFANIVVDTMCDGGSNAVRLATPTTGSYTGVHARVKYVNAPTASTSPPVLGTNALNLDYHGPVYGSFGLPGADGSRYVDTTAGTFRIRKAGAWVTL